MSDPAPPAAAPDADPVAACEAVLGHHFADPALLRLALTHASAKAAGLASNQRLEFLGDAVLGAVMSEHLYRALPEAAEGVLTRARAAVVSSRALARACRTAGLDRFLTLGKGIRGGALPQSVYANAVEAVLGAVHLDGGPEAARGAALRLLDGELRVALAGEAPQNWKALLQHHAQTRWRTTPTYRVVAEDGPAHGRTFDIVAVLGAREFPAGRGRSKKAAEQAAARAALDALAGEA